MTKEEKYKRNIYMKAYHKQRMENDPEYAIRSRKNARKRVNEYSKKNKDKLKASRIKNKPKRKIYEQSEVFKLNQKKYVLANSESIAKKKALYYEENKERLKNYHSDRKEKRNSIRRKNYSDPINKLKNNIRSLVTTGIKKAGYTKRSKLTRILGCSFFEFKGYIENQFTDGMGWVSIHCDHIIPISIAKTEKDILMLSHYSNLRPCLKVENLKKSAKIDIELIKKHNLFELYNTLTLT